MLRLTSLAALLGLAVTGITLESPAQPAPPKAAQPSAPPASPAGAAPKPAAPAAPAQQPAPAAPGQTLAPAERAGVVLVEHAGRVIGLGTVLNADGRIITSFSRIASAQQGPLFVRYSDGALVQARVGHSDKDRDLALLVPRTLHSRAGIQASRAGLPAPGTPLSGFSIAPNRAVTRATHQVKSSMQSAGRRVLDVTPVPKALDLGGPLLDARGQAFAIAVSGCLGPPGAKPVVGAAAAAPTPPGCTAEPIGMPVAEIRTFLRELPPDAVAVPAWLGIEGTGEDTGTVRGIRITGIEPKSPAATLGLQVTTEAAMGELLVAVAGQPVTSVEALRAELSRHAPGQRVELLLYGKNGYRIAAARLAERPASP
ncbi:MAG TPA: PDZ domain-containing protein [Polyangiaceae bacterium]